MRYIFETPRLRLTKIALSDTLALFACWSDPEVTRFMNMAPMNHIGQAAQMIELLNLLWDKKRTYRWTIALKANKEVIGSCGYNLWDRDNRRGEIGYDLRRSFWGQGLMTEALHGLINLGFGPTMSLHRIQALVQPDNGRSRQVLEKIGFQAEGLLREFEYSRDVFQDVVMYSLLKQEML